MNVVPDPGHRISLHYDIVTMPFCVAVDTSGIVQIAGLINSRRGLEEALEVMRAGERRTGPALDGTIGLQGVLR